MLSFSFLTLFALSSISNRLNSWYSLNLCSSYFDSYVTVDFRSMAFAYSICLFCSIIFALCILYCKASSFFMRISSWIYSLVSLTWSFNCKKRHDKISIYGLTDTIKYYYYPTPIVEIMLLSLKMDTALVLFADKSYAFYCYCFIA